MQLATPLHSRFGRRLLLLFVGCALVPIGVVAAVAYRHVTEQLHLQSERRLHQANKALALAIFERLLLLDATLKSIPARAVFRLGEPDDTSSPKVRPRGPVPSRGGNHTQSGRSDGRVAVGGIVLDRHSVRAPLARPPAAEEREARRTLTAGLDLLARRRFIALELIGDDGRRIPVFGRLERVPGLSGPDSSDLAFGLPLILSEQIGRASCRERV